jgi:hypothetical protein
LPLQSVGVDQQLTAASDPAYTGPTLPTSSEPITFPPVGVPPAGPYTVWMLGNTHEGKLPAQIMLHIFLLGMQVSPRVMIMLGVCARRGRPRHPYRV